MISLMVEIIDIVDGCDWYCQWLRLISKIIDIIDGCDWYRRWLRLISKIIDIDRWYVDIGIVDGQDY